MFRIKKIISIVIIIALSSFVICPSGICTDQYAKQAADKLQKAMITEGNYAKVKEKLDLLLKTYPKNPYLYMNLGIASYGLMEYGKAYEYFKKAESLSLPKDIEGLVKYSLTRLEENKLLLSKMEKDKTDLKDAKDPLQKDIKKGLMLGHQKLLAKLLEEEYHFPSIVTAHIIWLKENAPESKGLYYISGYVYYVAMFYIQAEDDYRKAIENSPNDPQLYQAMGDCLVAMGDFDGAEVYYDRSIKLYKKKGARKNRTLINRLTKVRESLPRKYLDIDALIAEGRYREAIRSCKRRIAFNRADFVAITQLGEVYWKTGHRRKAIKLFQKVIKRIPDYPIAHFLLGKAYAFKNQTKEAIEEFEIFKEKMQLLPKMDSDTITFYTSSLHYIAYIYYTMKQYNKAMNQSLEIIKIQPDDQSAHYNLAGYYYNFHRNREAAYRELQKVIKIDPNTDIAGRAEFFIDYIRRNPDPRFEEDFTFYYAKESESD